MDARRTVGDPELVPPGVRENVEAGRWLVPQGAFAVGMEEYRNETEVVKRFLADDCVGTDHQDNLVPLREVHAANASRSKDNGEPVVTIPGSRGQFGRAAG